MNIKLSRRQLSWGIPAVIAVVIVPFFIAALAKGDLRSYRGVVEKYVDAYVHQDAPGMQAQMCDAASRRLAGSGISSEAFSQERARVGVFTSYDVLRGEPREAWYAVDVSGRELILRLPIVEEASRFRVCPRDDHLLGELE